MIMKKIYQYILMAVAIVAMASCSEKEMFEPDAQGTTALRVVVGDFPAFGGNPQTRASNIGTPDAGKTAWEEGDEIFVTLISAHFGTQHAVLTYGGSTWTLAGELNYLADESVENAKLDIIATYAPYYELKDGELSLTDEYALGKGEYLEVKCYIIEGVLNVSFEEAIRNYSRIRIVCSDGVEELSVRALCFIPAGHERQSSCEIQHVPVDDNGNAFIYGTFEEDGSIEVEDWDIEGAKLAVHGFTETTMSDKSYALDARAISIDGSLGGKSEATMEDIEELARFLESSVDEGKTTFVVTGESQAIYDNKYPYVGYGIAEVSYSKYFGTLNFTYCNVTEIIEADLAECKSLKTLKLPYVTSCAKDAFYNCSHLEKIIFGSVVTFVGEDAFEKVDNYVDGGCELVLNKEQVNVEGLSPDLTNKTWAGHTWKNITLK
mgnify:FL=1